MTMMMVMTITGYFVCRLVFVFKVPDHPLFTFNAPGRVAAIWPYSVLLWSAKWQPFSSIRFK